VVGQDRQHHQRQHAELQHRDQVAVRQLARQHLQLGLEVEQDGGQDGQHHRQGAVVVPDHGAVAVGEQQGDHRGGAGVFRVGAYQVGADDGCRHYHHAGAEQPGSAALTGQQAEDAAEQRGQAESAQAGARGFAPLALQPHEQAEAERKNEALDEFQADIGDKIIHGLPRQC